MPEQLINDNIATLQQAEALLHKLSGTEFSLGERVGPHLRHVLDHYDCFLDGVQHARVTYDERERDSTSESCAKTARQRITRIIARLGESQHWPERLLICLATNADDQSQLSWSSIERELQFLQSHAVHHYALIRLLLEQQGIPLNADFGKAPSTLQYERASA